MKKILSIVFLVVPLLFFTYGCGEETQAKVPPAVQNVVEKTKTAIEKVETAAVEAVEDVVHKEEEPVAESTEVTTEEEEPVAESTEVTTEEEKPVAESTEVTIEEELAVEPVAMAVDLKKGAMVFKQNCAACHAGGRNVVNAMKTLKKEALVKYDMYDTGKITYQITNGKNAMPAFKGRLSDEQIEQLAGYVLAQADKGW